MNDAIRSHFLRFTHHVSRITSPVSLFTLFSSLFFLLLAFGTSAGYPQVAGTTEVERAAFARQGEALAQFIVVLVPAPSGVETLAGYVQWRVYGGLPVFLAALALFTATDAIRGQEGRGLLEQWLAAGVGRGAWVVIQAGRFAVNAALTVVAVAVGALAGGFVAGEPIDPAGLAGVTIAGWTLALCCFGIVLVVSELVTTRRQAIGVGLIALGALFGMNGVARIVPESGLGQITPFAWYERTQSVRSGGAFDGVATLALLATALGLFSLAAWLCAGRDLGAPALRLSGRQRARRLTPSPNPVWGNAIMTGLYRDRFLLLAFVLIGVVLAILFSSLAKPIVDLLTTLPATRSSARLLAGDPYRTLLGYFLFGSLQLLIAVYGVVQVADWVSEAASGRLAFRLTAPVSRRSITGDRLIRLLIGVTVLAWLGALAGAFAAAHQGIVLDVGGIGTAALALVPFGLGVGGIGAWLATIRPGVAVPFAGSFVALSSLLLEIGTLFGWPEWLLSLSVFQLYGNPLATGPNWPGLLALTGIGLAGFLSADHRVRVSDLIA